MDFDAERLLLRLINRIEELEDRVKFLEKQLGTGNAHDEDVPLTMPKTISANSDIKKAMIILARREAISEEEIVLLQNPAWCVNTLRLNFPLLRPVEEGRLDEKGYPRYWRDEPELHGKKYYICSQWYPHNRPYFEKWLEEKVKK